MAGFEASDAAEPLAWRWPAVLPIRQATLAAGVAKDQRIGAPRRLPARLFRRAALCGSCAGCEPQDVFVGPERLAAMHREPGAA